VVEFTQRSNHFKLLITESTFPARTRIYHAHAMTISANEAYGIDNSIFGVIILAEP